MRWVCPAGLDLLGEFFGYRELACDRQGYRKRCLDSCEIARFRDVHHVFWHVYLAQLIDGNRC